MLHIDLVYDALNRHGAQISKQQICCVRNDRDVFIVFADGKHQQADRIVQAWEQQEHLLSSYELVLQEIRQLQFAEEGFAAVIWYSNVSSDMLVVQVHQPCCVLYRQYERFGAAFAEDESMPIWWYGWQARPQDIVAMFVHPVVYRQIGLHLSFGWLRAFGKDSKLRQQDQFACSRMLLADVMHRLSSVFATLQISQDNTLVAIVQCLAPVSVCWMTGPPSQIELDVLVVQKFMAEKGVKIISGSTTAEIAGRILQRKVVAFPKQAKSDIPPISYMEGMDLVSEGAITIHKVASLLALLQGMHSLLLMEQEQQLHDGAFLLTRLLCAKGTKIQLLVGLARNPDHSELLYQQKLADIAECAKILADMGKEVTITYF